MILPKRQQFGNDVHSGNMSIWPHGLRQQQRLKANSAPGIQAATSERKP
jgi:hypothetical protein